jgi:hypothetical protein
VTTTADTTARTLRLDAARLAYLGDPAICRCVDCGTTIRAQDGYSALDADGDRGYACAACTFDPRFDIEPEQTA